MIGNYTELKDSNGNMGLFVRSSVISISQYFMANTEFLKIQLNNGINIDVEMSYNDVKHEIEGKNDIERAIKKHYK